MLIAGGVIALCGIYLVITALLARRELESVRADVSRMRAAISSGNLATARKAAVDLSTHANHADTLTSGPIWYLAAGIPAGGEPLRTVRGLTATVDSLSTSALPELVEASREIDPSRLRRADGSIDLAPIVSVSPQLSRAASAVEAANQDLAQLPADTWLASVDQARRDALRQFASLGATVESADKAARVAPLMLGQNGPMRYFVSFQTEAELRGTGGLPGAFAIMRADHGKISFERFGSDTELLRVKSGLSFGPAYAALYAGSNATQDYLDSNSSPNFPYAAQIWTRMWQVKSGEHLDGAIALDPTALSYLLRVAGPARLDDGTVVNAANVVSLTQKTVYDRFQDRSQTRRKAFQLQLAKKVSRRLLVGASNATGLVRAAGRAAGERRLMVWSRTPAVERVLASTALGGTVDRTTRPFLGLSLNNAAANKLDYYLDASVSWSRTGCGARRDVTVRLTLRNDAPAHLPTYVVGSAGGRFQAKRVGDNRTLVGYFATSGAILTKVTVDGAAAGAQIGSELGHPVYTLDMHLGRGKTRVVVLHLLEPAETGKPVVMPQPLVRPLRVSVQDSKCG